MATASKLMTAEEFMAADLGEEDFELVRGVAVPIPPCTPLHGRACALAAFHVGSFGQRTGFGYALSNGAPILSGRGPDTVRAADVSLYSEARWPRSQVGDALPPVPPDLAVEVFTAPGGVPESLRSRTASEMLARVAEYLSAGVAMVWVLHPGRRTLAIYRPDDPVPVVLGEGEVVENLPELPGFRCAVADLFL